MQKKKNQTKKKGNYTLIRVSKSALQIYLNKQISDGREGRAGHGSFNQLDPRRLFSWNLAAGESITQSDLRMGEEGRGWQPPWMHEFKSQSEILNPPNFLDCEGDVSLFYPTAPGIVWR